MSCPQYAEYIQTAAGTPKLLRMFRKEAAILEQFSHFFRNQPQNGSKEAAVHHIHSTFFTMIGEDLKHLRELVTKEPSTKSGLIRMLWPEIEKALNAGHSIKEICFALNRDGIEINYSNLRHCIACLKRKNVDEMKQPERGSFEVPTDPDSSNSNDPRAALKTQRARKTKFDHNPFSSRIKDLV